MKECWIVWDSHNEVVGVYETGRDARDKVLSLYEEIAELNDFSEEEITETSNELYNESFYENKFGVDGIVYCEKAKYFPNSLTL